MQWREASLDGRFLPGVKADVMRWQRELRVPTILVTEDPMDALNVADRVAVGFRGEPRWMLR